MVNIVVGMDDEFIFGGFDVFGQVSKSVLSICVVGVGGNDEVKVDVKFGKIYGEVVFDFVVDFVQNFGELYIMVVVFLVVGKMFIMLIQVIIK